MFNMVVLCCGWNLEIINLFIYRNWFAGGIQFVSLHSMVQNKPVRRNLDDKNLTVASSGVTFDSCLTQVYTQ